MNNINSYQNYTVKIVINKKLKHSYISIDKNKNVLVKTSQKSQSFIDSLLKEKSNWIQKQFLKIENLQIIENKALYPQDFLQSRVIHFSQYMNLKFTKLKFKKMKSRWGSCNSKREITLNSELSRLNKNLIDYVVVHELAHIRYMNHSKEFHQLIDKHLVNAKKYRIELKNISLIN